MNPNTAPHTSSMYTTMEKALHILVARHEDPPSLQELASSCGLSAYHFQKQFSRWVGISPKRFSQYLSKEHVKALLDQGMPPLEAGYQAGLSGPGRLHDLFINTEAMTPAQYRKQGQNLSIHYGLHDSPFGPYLLAVTDKGICHLAFITGELNAVVQQLNDNWSLSDISRDDNFTQAVHKQLFGSFPEAPDHTQRQISLLLKGTNFQIQVWQALLKIPFGRLSSYENLAALAGKPAATRASASAIARNNIAWLIPCHRVVRKIGETGQYRWGKERKQVILGYEAASLAWNKDLPDQTSV